MANASRRSERAADHRVLFEASPKRVRAMFDGKTVADTLRAGLVLETGHMPVYYFPREDVRMDLLERTNHRSHCPYKGDAGYFSLQAGGKTSENAVWTYEQPFEAVGDIAEHVAFYPDRVDSIEVVPGSPT